MCSDPRLCLAISFPSTASFTAKSFDNIETLPRSPHCGSSGLPNTQIMFQLSDPAFASEAVEMRFACVNSPS